MLLAPIYEDPNNREYGNPIVIPHEVVQDCYGAHNNYSAIELLERFQAETDMGLALLSDYERPLPGVAGKCRVYEVAQDEEVKRWLLEEASSVLPAEDEVVFSTGESWSRYKADQARREASKDIMLRGLDPDHPAYGLVEYLHSRKVLCWLNRQFELTAQTLHRMAQELSEDECLYAERVLDAIDCCPGIPYKSVENSTRIFADGCSAMSLHRSMRKAFFSGTWSADIRACQFAIAAREWGLKDLHDFLDKGGSIWKEFARYQERPVVEIKDHLKTMGYSGLFGMSCRHISEALIEALCDDRLMSHPFMEQVLKARAVQQQIVIDHKGAEDAFGRWIPMPEIRAKGKEYWERQNEAARSIVCQVIQSHEMRMMLRLFEDIKDSRDIMMVGFLHDGCYLTLTHHKERAGAIMSGVKERFDKYVQKDGYPTELETEEIPGRGDDRR